MLQDRRRAAGLTQRQLAERTGLSIGAIRDLEQGRTRQARPDSLRRLASALGLPVEHVYTDGVATSGTSRRSLGLRLKVLGPLTAWRHGEQVSLGQPKQRALLGMLALSPNMYVSRDRLIDVLWPKHPPANAWGNIHAYVSRLRRVLHPRPYRRRASAEIVMAQRLGYMLRVSPNELDLLELNSLTQQAKQAQEVGELTTAHQLVSQAVGLWQGSPLADLPTLHDEPAVRALRSRWTALVLDHADLAAVQGRHDYALPLLLQLAATDALDGSVHARLMIALAGSGQQAAALAVYHEIRQRLADQLGVSPDPVLVEAHQLVLRHHIIPQTSRIVPLPASEAARLNLQMESGYRSVNQRHSTDR